MLFRYAEPGHFWLLGGVMETLLQDVRYAIRTLTRKPGFAVFAVLTLALGIGANTAIFSMVNAVLLRPLALREPERILLIWESRGDSDKLPISIPEFLDLQAQNRSFSQMAALANWNANLSGEETPERLQGMQASASFFETLGVQANIGRTLLPADAAPGSPRTVVLSYGFWSRHYGGDRTIVGKAIRLNGDSYTVVGVLPASFVYRQVQDEVITPLVFENDARREQRGNNFLRTFGRLKPGVTQGQAREDLLGMIREIRRQNPSDNTAQTGVFIEELQSAILGKVSRSLTLLLGAVLAVLLIACANLAGLFLVRASARTKEVAIRVALGASRARLMQQLLTESLLVAIVGGALGLIVGSIGIHALIAISPADLPRAKEIELDARVLEFTILISLLCGVIFGTVPALELSKVNLNEEMKEGGRDSSGGSARQRVRQLLMVAQVAISLILLVGSGLLLKSFVRLEAVDPGFNAKNLLVVRLALPKTHYKGRESVIVFYRALSPRIENLPGVKSVAVANVVPTDGFLATVDFNLVGRGWMADQFPEAHYRMTTPGYFHTLAIPLLAGREFTESDTEQSARVAIINQTFAKRYWPSGNPIGAHLQMDDTQQAMREVEIVGVVGDVHDFGLENDSRAEIYAPIPQVPGDTLSYLKNNMCWFVRTENEPLSAAAPFREEVKKLDPDVPASNVRTVEQYMAQSIAPRRFTLVLVGIFGAAALFLAAMGIYAVLSYSVAQRTSEIGIRMALGAQRAEVFRLIVGNGLALVGGGAAVGLVTALLVTRLMKGLLYGVSAADPLTYLAITVLLLAIATLACYVPGRRAMSVDPLIALRHD
jgi:putative ABC transport system permease protein